jgi:hypothetical protein
MAQDWETALKAFERAALAHGDDFGEAIYGRYLARLFRVYADFNNLFFEDAFGAGFNQTHLTRDLHDPASTQGRVTLGHVACLAKPVYRYGNLFFNTSLIDIDLQRIVDGRYSLRGIEESALPIRWGQGKCAAPLFDGVFRGVWDWVDAVIMYLHAYGSPAEAKRFVRIFGPRDAPSKTPCPPDDELCGPYVKDGEEVARVPRDAEFLLNLVFQAGQGVFDPNRFVPGQEPIFFWRDTNGNGQPDASDGFTAQLYQAITGEPVLDLQNATLGAQWTPRQAAPPANPAPAQTFIFCPQGQDDPSCHLLPGEQALVESPPAWQQLQTKNIPATPSPDGSRVVFSKQVEVGDEKVWQYFVTDNAMDAEGNPVCSAPNGDCCLTCQALPVGIRQAGHDLTPRNPEGPSALWIPNPANPKGPARGVLFLHNEHPSAWGFNGQAQATQFYAIRPDGTGFSQLIQGSPPDAFHYQALVSPDGAQLLWTSTWDPESNRAAGTHTLLLADLVEENDAFRLANVHSIIPIRDHGWYETGAFAPDYPQDRRVFFSSSSTSFQSPRVYAATLTPEGVIDEVFKLTFPEELFPEPFVTDFHPGWYEFPFPLDQGKQFYILTTFMSPIAMDRFDRFLAFPPFLTGSYVALTLFDIRFAGGSKIGYAENQVHVLGNIDGSNLQALFTAARAAGWFTIGPDAPRLATVDGQLFFTQRHLGLGLRYGVIRFVQ